MLLLIFLFWFTYNTEYKILVNQWLSIHLCNFDDGLLIMCLVIFPAGDSMMYQHSVGGVSCGPSGSPSATTPPNMNSCSSVTPPPLSAQPNSSQNELNGEPMVSAPEKLCPQNVWKHFVDEWMFNKFMAQLLNSEVQAEIKLIGVVLIAHEL